MAVGWKDLERSQYPALKADIYGGGSNLRDMTSEILEQGLEVMGALSEQYKERRWFLNEWWRIITWLWGEGLREEAAEIASIVAMAASMGPPFITNSRGYERLNAAVAAFRARAQA